MKVAVIIPAAGLGTRMGRSEGAAGRKQFVSLDGAPILLHTVRKFANAPKVSEILIALRQEDRESVERELRRANLSKPVRLVEGGRNRQESVANGLAQIDDDTDLVAVHDAVRPFVTLAQIDEIIAQAAEHGAVILGIPPVDTVKQVNRTQIQSTLLRERIVLAQTPQVFRLALLRRAFEQAQRDGFVGTDEASLVEHLGEPVHVMLGSDRNIKITKPSDLALARLFYEEETGRAPEPPSEAAAEGG
jgi:2-C-methyl-D-erythritol 4-phosphate cytidylyltransferase